MVGQGKLCLAMSLNLVTNEFNLQDGKVIKNYTGSGGIFEVSWNSQGDKLAACFSNNTVVVLDVRM
jgi:transducin (beta)-like 1